jgi:hypothetical protein
MLHRTRQVVTPDAPGPVSGRCPLRFQRRFCVTGRIRASDAPQPLCCTPRHHHRTHEQCHASVRCDFLLSVRSMSRELPRTPDDDRMRPVTTDQTHSVSEQQLHNRRTDRTHRRASGAMSGACFSTGILPKSSEPSQPSSPLANMLTPSSVSPQVHVC